MRGWNQRLGSPLLAASMQLGKQMLRGGGPYLVLVEKEYVLEKGTMGKTSLLRGEKLSVLSFLPPWTTEVLMAGLLESG